MGNGVGMWGIRVEMQGISVRMLVVRVEIQGMRVGRQGMGVEMWGIRLGMQIYKYLIFYWANTNYFTRILLDKISFAVFLKLRKS